MLKFNKQLATLAFLTLIVTGTTMPAVANKNQTPAEKLCRLRRGIKPVCTVYVSSPRGVIIYSGPSFNHKKMAVIPHRWDVNVRVSKYSREWVKLSDRPGWIHYRNLVMVG